MTWRGSSVIEGGYERKDGGSGVGGAVEVADVNLVERGFANAEHQRTLLLETNVGGSLDKVAGVTAGDAGKGAHAAGDDDHGVGGVGTAGDVGSDVGIGLQVKLARGLAEQVSDEVVASAEGQFLGHDAQGAVRGDQVDSANAPIALSSEQEVFEE